MLADQSSVRGCPGAIVAAARPDAVDPLVARCAPLALIANVYFGDEYEEAFSVEADFYLLDQSLIEILKSAGFKPEFADDRARDISDEDYLEAAARALTASGGAEAEVIAFLINDRMRRHRAATAATNRFGRGGFKPVKPGGYYLFGIGRTEAEVFVWHQPVRVMPGGAAIEVDQNDAAVIFDAED